MHTSDSSTLSPDQLLNLTLSEEQVLISGLLREFPDNGDPKVYLENLKVIGRFLHSDHMERIPSNEIRASLWASLADQFVNQGRKKPIESGMVTDIEMLSSLLPYCDIVLVDREMWGLYNRKEVRGVIEGKYGARVFSLANKAELLDELGLIKDAASKRHLATVKKVYGEDWPRPFVSIYES